MPYIDEDRKRELELTGHTVTSGDLTYALTVVALAHLEGKPDVRYADLAEVLGCFDSASKEFYRRIVAPYENQKIKDNGDVVQMQNLIERLKK